MQVKKKISHSIVGGASVMCCHVKSSVTGLSLVQRSPGELCVCVWSDAKVTLYTCREKEEEVIIRMK